MNKKRISIILCVLLVAVMTAGCAGNGKQGSKANADGKQDAKADTDGKEDAKADTGGKQDAKAGTGGKQDAKADTGGKEDAKKAKGGDAAPKEWDPSDESNVVKAEDVEAAYGKLPADAVKKGMTFGAVLPEASNEYWKTAARGMEDFCKKHGIKTDVQFALTAEDQSGQLASAETFAKKNLDAYVFAPMTADLMTNVTNQLKEKGKPVINAYFTPMENADVFVGAMDSQVAKMAAQHTIDVLGGKGKVAMAMAAVASRTNQVRCGLYKEYLEAHSDIKVVAEMPAEWVPEKAMQMTQDLLTKTPDIDLIWCANDNLALGVMEGLRSRDALGKTKVLSMDATTSALKAVKAGELFGTYSTDPYYTGQMCAEICLRKIAGQDIARVIACPVKLVDSSNVDEFLK